MNNEPFYRQPEHIPRRKTPVKAIIGSVFSLLFLAGLFIYQFGIPGMGPQREEVAEGSDFVHFEAENLEGDEINTRLIRSRLIVLVFWSPWSTPSLDALPSFGPLDRDTAASELRIIGIGLDATPEEIAAAANDMGLEFEQVATGAEELRLLYNVRAVPTVFVSDGGTVVHIERGDAPIGEIEQLLRQGSAQ